MPALLEIYQSLIMFVEVNHGMNKGDLGGPQKKSCCSSGWKMLQNHLLKGSSDANFTFQVV